MLRACVVQFLCLACFLPLIAFGDSLQIETSRIKSAPIRYVQHSSLHEFPVPVISWRRGGLASGVREIEEIKEKVIYPTIIESRKPVAAISVEFHQANPRAIGVVITWSDGDTREALIDKNEKGQYDSHAYKILFAKPTP